ncbi:ankyrin repeat-containing domain protein [Neocallimastix lanati (nom. inval.)]|nr:ankyrin repeat-containing domain protein [Neocallimastix sp. JGI-2020a]
MSVIEENKNDILQLIEKNNISLLRQFVDDNNISLKSLNSESFDILIYAIEKNASIEIIKYIMNQCKYETYNYYTLKDDSCKVPLYSAITKNKFKLSDLLIKNNADINYFNPNAIEFLLENFSLNPKNLKYILHNGFDIDFVNTDLINTLIERKKAEFLDVIFKFYIFNNDFILNLLNMYRNKRAISDKDFKDMLFAERNKISVDDSNYEHANTLENPEAIKVLFNNDGCEKDIKFCRINEFEILSNAVKTNDCKFVEKVLSYEPFTFKSVDTNEILLEVNNNNNLDIMKLLIHSALDAFVTQPNKQNSSSNDKYDVQYLSYILNMMIKIRNLSFIKYLVEDEEYKSYIDINAKDINAEYPMMTAFCIDDLEIFEYLLKHGGDCNIKNCNGHTLLSLAIDKADGNDYIKKILSHNPTTIKEEYINASDSFMKAIHNDKIYIVVQLLQYGLRHNIDMNTIDRNGNTPLILSYRLNYQTIFRFLVKYLDINQPDANGNTILYYAILKEDMETLKYLISNGADVNYKNKLGRSSLDLMILKGYAYLDIVLDDSNKILLNVPNLQGENALITLIKINSYSKEEQEDMIERLIRGGSNVNFVDSVGNTPLMYAIQRKSLDITKLLIKNDANINFVEEKTHQSILMYAIEIGELEIIKLLVEYGANINYSSSGDNSVIKKAYPKEKLKIFEYLVSYDLNNFTNQVIYDIIEEERLDLLALLVKHGFDVNMQDTNHDTALIYSIKARKPDITKYLITNGADVNHQNKQGETAEQLIYKYFYEYGWQKIYDTLLNLINKNKNK